MRENWSPEQIAAMLPVLFPRDLKMWVSHETMYQSVFAQTRTGGAKRVALGITDDIRISARPAEVKNRAVAGQPASPHDGRV